MMNKITKSIAVIVAALALAVIGNAQVTTTTNKESTSRSYSTTLTSTSLTVTWLRDKTTSFAGVTYPVFTFKNTADRLTLETVAAINPDDVSHNVNVGAALAYKTPIGHDGYAFKVYGGAKGFNLADNVKFQDGSKGYVYGVAITFLFN